MTMKPMSPLDAAWYQIDGPVNLAMVTGILLTKEPLDFARVKKVFAHRLRRFERFSQRVVEARFPPGKPYWEDVPHFNFAQQMHHVGLPAPHTKAALIDLINDLVSTPLDRGRPLWDVHVVDNVEGGSGLILRFHHCIGDGTAMMAVALELFDSTPDAPLARGPVVVAHPQAGLLDQIIGPAIEAVDWSTSTVTSTWESVSHALRHPEQVLEQAGAVIWGAGMLVSELLKTPDPLTPLKGEFGLEKRVAWSEPVAIEDIKSIGATSGAKVNDVLVAGMTGALRTYLAKRGVDVDRNTLRAMVPVDLRPRERAIELGNAFGLVVLDLAVGKKHPLERLRVTKANMDALKRSPEAMAILTLFNLFGRGPKVLEDFAVDLFGSKASLVMTNVVGPREPLYLAGVPIDRTIFWVPHPGRQLGMGISIFSYNGTASLAVVSDAHLVPDPEAITAQFNREFQRMLAMAKPVRAKQRRPPREPRRPGAKRVH